MAHSTYPATRRPLASTLLPGWFSAIFSYISLRGKQQQQQKKITISKCIDKKIHQLPEDLWWPREIWGTPIWATLEIVGRKKGNILEKLLSPFQQRRSALTAPNQSWAPATRAEWRGRGPKESIRIQGIPWFMVSEWEVWEQIYLESTKLDWTAFFSALLIFAPKNTIEIDQSSNFHFLIAQESPADSCGHTLPYPLVATGPPHSSW